MLKPFKYRWTVFCLSRLFFFFLFIENWTDALLSWKIPTPGGGEREHYFWKNFFFHCAYARYEAGLSIDEIWNDEDPAERKTKQDAEAAAAAVAATEKTGEPATPTDEETITFDNNNESASPSNTPGTSNATTPATTTQETSIPSAEPAAEGKSSEAPPTSTDEADTSANDYENISSDNFDDGFGEDGFDAELDELEAEIARELEDWVASRCANIIFQSTFYHAYVYIRERIWNLCVVQQIVLLSLVRPNGLYLACGHVKVRDEKTS